MSLGPVPVYFNINFSASAGICLEGLYFSFAFDKGGDYQGMEWWVLRGVTIDIRLALTVTLGIGVKGICSVWVSATGALNIILTTRCPPMRTAAWGNPPLPVLSR